MKKTKGFTIVELIIVIVIVGILAIVSIPIYRGYTLKSKMTEGKSLAASVITSQRVYYSEFGVWYTINGWVEENPVLDIDARNNAYFKKVKTGHSALYTNVISAEALSESENLIIYQFWPYDMNQAASYPKWRITDASGALISEEW